MGGVLLKAAGQPKLCFTSDYPVYLMVAIAGFLECLLQINPNSIKVRQFIEKFYNPWAVVCIKQMDQNNVGGRQSLATNWFSKIEVLLLLNIVKINNNIVDWKLMDKPVVLRLSYQLLTHLSQDLVVELLYLFDEIVFNAHYFSSLLHNDEDNEQRCLINNLPRYRNLYMDTILAALDANKASVLIDSYRK